MAHHSFHGAPGRFEATARFVADRFPNAQYVADVAGGQGMLARILTKRYNKQAELIDPRGWALRGVASRQEAYEAGSAEFYDLVVGLHPDQALRPVVESAQRRPVLVVPCCNFWDPETRLGRAALTEAITRYHEERGGSVEPVTLGFAGPMNRGLVLLPSDRRH
ncbi:hypothetical protein GCM10011575_11320 [Microlunatus endophyticus]|uniref:Methyltransferase domain-containing protein n=1 Tax=Microlunatus endophyticus TaxID=1716077 RepID=A0A917S3P0_9ACTN|nr:hypothetical protein [Microlunatus endophyticus]GGL54655.1 hypothetical protein GCM10011575_11320 [Microlunatus endophyticus]